MNVYASPFDEAAINLNRFGTVYLFSEGLFCSFLNIVKIRLSLIALGKLIRFRGSEFFFRFPTPILDTAKWPTREF